MRRLTSAYFVPLASFTICLVFASLAGPAGLSAVRLPRQETPQPAHKFSEIPGIEDCVSEANGVRGENCATISPPPGDRSSRWFVERTAAGSLNVLSSSANDGVGNSPPITKLKDIEKDKEKKEKEKKDKDVETFNRRFFFLKAVTSTPPCHQSVDSSLTPMIDISITLTTPAGRLDKCRGVVLADVEGSRTLDNCGTSFFQILNKHIEVEWERATDKDGILRDKPPTALVRTTAVGTPGQGTDRTPPTQQGDTVTKNVEFKLELVTKAILNTAEVTWKCSAQCFTAAPDSGNAIAFCTITLHPQGGDMVLIDRNETPPEGRE